jgi:hypothetical protein
MPKIDELAQPSINALRAITGVPAVESRATSLEGRVGAVESN